MKFVLILLLCSVIDGKTNCLDPHRVEVEYPDAYDCMLAGYTLSHEKIVALGREDVNKFNIYIRFGCHESQSNKTAVSSIFIK
jgi:hypothetical protein